MITRELKDVILGALRLSEWDIEADTVASEVPGWDSLAHIDVILAVETHFGVRFTNAEVMKLRTIGDLQRLVDARRQV